MTAVEEPSLPTVYETALAAHEAGLCVVPAMADGSKRPRGNWQRYQTERPTLQQLEHWFANGHPAIGIVCGEVSGNLEMLELEGVAVLGGIQRDVLRLAKEAGIEHIVYRLIAGYYESTPSNGVHWLYRVAGEAVGGNVKLATRPTTEAERVGREDYHVTTLIETRGEGGFTIIAPSHGATHPNGIAWVLRRGGIDTIPTITADEREQLFDVCRQLHQPSPIVVKAPTLPASQRVAPAAFQGTVGPSWIECVTSHLAAAESWDNILTRYGWRYLRDDRHGSAMYVRPGKDDGVGAWVKNDRLCVFSSSTPLDSSQRSTLDRLDVIAGYEHGNDRKAAARDIADRTGILKAWQHEQDVASGKVSPDTPPPTATPALDTTTGEIVVSGRNLPDEFWNARPILAHIRQAAHSRIRSADSVLLSVLGRIAALTPPTVVLPAIVGSKASLNYVGGVVATSGGGKSSGNALARELLPIDVKTIRADAPPGSGEGLVELYFEMVAEEGPDGKNRKVKRQTIKSAFIYLDEGQALAEMGSRKGAVLMPTLRSAWSGEVIGQSNATQETHRVLMAHSYRMAVVVGFQLEYAAAMIADAAGGTPQRFLFATAIDPSVPDIRPTWPGTLPYRMPDVVLTGTELEFATSICTEITARALAATRGDFTPHHLDSHRDLVTMKVAGLLALLDGSYSVTEEDWQLALLVVERSAAVRQWAIDYAAELRTNTERSHRDLLIGREEASERAAVVRATISGAKSIAKRCHKVGGLMTHRDAILAVSSRHRATAGGIDDMIDHAVREGWLSVADGGWTAGGKAP